MVEELREWFSAGDFERVCRQFSAAQPASADEWLLYGRSQLALGRPDQADRCFAHGQELEPNSRGLRFYGACALARLRRWRDLEVALAPCLEDAAWRRRAVLIRAKARVMVGLWADARRDFAEVDREGGLSPSDALGYAACLAQLNAWDEARPVLQRLLAGGKGSPVAWLLQGRCHEAQGNWAEAADTYRRGLQQHFESRLLASRLSAVGRRPAARRPDWLLHTYAGRQDVLQRWLEAQQEDPAEARWAHRIALLASFTAEKVYGVRRQFDRRMWTLAVANWAFLLENQAWQDDFVRSRSSVYGRPAEEQDWQEFRRLLQEHAERLVAAAANVVTGEPTLREMFLRERQAAQACQTCLVDGGLALPRTSRPVAGGPLWLAGFSAGKPFPTLLGRGVIPGSAAEGWPWPDPERKDDAESYVRQLFSSAGFALARLRSGDPRGALESLRWTVCPLCVRTGRRGSSRTVSVCRDECPDFALRNPGLADLPDRSQRLHECAEWIRLQSHLALAESALRLVEPDTATVAEHWREALAVTPPVAALVEHLTHILRDRAEALCDARRYEAVVKLLDGVAGCLPASESLVSTHAVALTDWGIQLANAGDLEAALAPLRRAVQLRPGLERACRNFLRAASLSTLHAARERRFDQAAGYWEEGRLHLPAAGADGRLPEFERELLEEWQTAGLELWRLRANEAFAKGRAPEAAQHFEEALRFAESCVGTAQDGVQAEHQMDEIRELLAVCCIQAGDDCFGNKDFVAALAWYERAQNATPDSSALRERIDLSRRHFVGKERLP